MDTLSRPPHDFLTREQIDATLRGEAPRPDCVYCAEPAAGFVSLAPASPDNKSAVLAVYGPEVGFLGAFLCRDHVEWSEQCPRSFEADVVANLITPYLPQEQS